MLAFFIIFTDILHTGKEAKDVTTLIQGEARTYIRHILLETLYKNNHAYCYIYSNKIAKVAKKKSM